MGKFLYFKRLNHLISIKRKWEEVHHHLVKNIKELTLSVELPEEITIISKKKNRILKKYNWAKKAIRRKTTGTGRMRYMKTIARRAKNNFRAGTTPVPKPRGKK